MNTSTTVPVSTQEEVDTLIILQGITVVTTPGNEVDLFTQDTDLFVLILKRLIELGNNTGIIKGTSENRRRVALLPKYEQLGLAQAAELSGFTPKQAATSLVI